jgi:hypothetical protein
MAFGIGFRASYFTRHHIACFHAGLGYGCAIFRDHSLDGAVFKLHGQGDPSDQQ